MAQLKPENIIKRNELHEKELKVIYGDRYTYLEFKIEKQQTQVNIRCNRCGKEWWSSVNNHKRNHGCKDCAIEDSNMTIEQIEAKAQKRHKIKYSYIEVYKDEKGFKQLKLSCPEHGEFRAGMQGHMKGQGVCPTCDTLRKKAGLNKDGSINKQVHSYTFEEAVEKARAIHGNKYTYLSIYKNKNRDSVLIMKCPIHGIRHHQVRYHIGERNGCVKCAKMKGVYTVKHAERYKEHWLKEESYLYTLYCFNDEESFYKVGVACKGVKLRYSGSLNMPYQYKILEERQINRYEAVITENKWKEEYAPKQITPKKRFGGFTECFSDIKHLDLKAIDLNSLKTYNRKRNK